MMHSGKIILFILLLSVFLPEGFASQRELPGGMGRVGRNDVSKKNSSVSETNPSADWMNVAENDASGKQSSASETNPPIDTILNRVMNAAEKYNNLVEHFTAEVYTRSYVEVVKKNFLYKYTHYIPRFVLHDPKHNEAIIETLSEVKYEAPNSFAQDIKQVTGSLTKKNDIDAIPFKLLNINIYGETSNEESFLMPLRFRTAKYYRYTLHSVFSENDKAYYCIRFSPVYKNTKLLRGHFMVEKGTWRITFFRGEGMGILSNYSFEMTMGSEWITNYLPVYLRAYETTYYLNNTLSSRHLTTLKYNDIRLRKTAEPTRPLNISDYYKVRLDSIPVVSDSLFWEQHRPIPLSDREKEIFSLHRQRQAEKAARKANEDSLSGSKIAQQMAQRMVMDSNYKYKSTRIGYSGLLNPLMLGYTSRDGITYRQRISFNFDLTRNRTLKIDANAGYMFRRKEFFTDMTSVWNYAPKKLGSATLSLGNGNPIYSSLFVEQIQKKLKEQKLSFEDISLKYYKDYYLKLFNTCEIVNGLLLQTGVDYHIRQSRKNPDGLRAAAPERGAIEHLFGTRRSFAPFVRINWTPRQYYRYEGEQKIYEHADFPTFKLELSRSFQNILGSTSEYNRIEFDISQNIPFGLMNSIQYHLGAGKFINQKTEYFADFVYFSNKNFPEKWGDGLGGIFNLLGRELYNASDSYIQAHFMFEAPFLILKNAPFISSFADKERLYLSQLYTPQIVSYTELGYGIGNRFFNAGFFTSFHKTRFRQIGVRAAFEF